jgi:membrane associated rhomboid family serine protease
LIPFRDTVEQKGPAAGVLIAIAVALVLVLTEVGKAGDTWQLLLGLIGLWLFGYYPARRLGTAGFLGLWVALLAFTALLVALLGDGDPEVEILPAILGVGLVHLAFAPRSKTLCLLPLPFAMTFFEVPTAVLLAVWVALEILLGQL